MSASRFAKLIDLAQAQSSAERRDLLREVTDLFFETEETQTTREGELFDDVLRQVAMEMEEGVLIELSRRFAAAGRPPKQLIQDLAENKISIAEAVLRQCRALSDEDLMRVMEKRGQEHMRAIAQRETVSEKLSEALVKKGDDETVNVLMRNDGAQLNRDTMEVVVDRAKASRALHEGVVNRKDLDLDLLNEMYFVVEQRLRTTIMKRNASVDPAELDAALALTRARMQSSLGEQSEDLRRAQRFIADKKGAGQLTPSLLISLYRDKQINHFLVGLADLTGVDYETARQIITRRDLDGLAMACRAAEMERPLFVTIAVLCCGGEKAMGRAEEFGKIYNAVPVESARRAMRFFKVRKGSAGEAAAA
jgi:uncharacterized protein (DUF2336 family)